MFGVPTPRSRLLCAICLAVIAAVPLSCSSTDEQLKDTALEVIVDGDTAPPVAASKPSFSPNTNISITIDWWLELDREKLIEYRYNHAYHLSLSLLWDILFVPLPRGELLALDKSDGSILWKAAIAGNISAGVVSDDDQVYVGTAEGELIAFHAVEGTRRWKKQLSSVAQAINATTDSVYVGTSDGSFYRLNRASGDSVWELEIPTPSLVIRGAGKPVLAGENILYGDDNGNLLVIDSANGKIIRQVTIGASRGYSSLDNIIDVQADIAMKGNRAYVSAWESGWVAFDWQKQSILWRNAELLFQPIQFQGNDLLVQSYDGTIKKVNALSGSTIWSNRFTNKLLTTMIKHDKWLAMADSGGAMYWVSRDNGAVVAHYVAESPWAMSATAEYNYLYVLNQLGQVLRFSIKQM